MISFTEAQLVAWLGWVMLPFFRILALFSAAPVLSQRAVPMRARVGLALLVAGTMAPSVTAPPAGFDPLSLAAAGFIAQEVAVGLAIGFVARLLFAAFDLAGEIIGLQMGLSFAGFFTPQGSQGNAVGSFLTTSASLIFVAMNGPLLMIAALLRSFTTLPIGNVPFEFAARFDPLALGAEVFALGLVIALPFMALILFTNLLIGVMSRVAPQLSLFSVGFPLTISVGLLLLAMTLPWMERPVAEGLVRLFTLFGS